jgi:hypothetical protein
LASGLWAVSPAPGDAVEYPGLPMSSCPVWRAILVSFMEYPGWTPLAWSIPANHTGDRDRPSRLETRRHLHFDVMEYPGRQPIRGRGLPGSYIGGVGAIR